MNYEKAYKEALERAQKTADDGMVSQNFVDDIFPLRETEDEKIREELLQFFHQTLKQRTTVVPKDNYERWIAYLEKQKNCCGKTLTRDNGESACSYIERCLTPEMRKVWYEACAEIKEKQKEQKPIEWSEEDKRKLNMLYSIVSQAADAHAFFTTTRLISDRDAIELHDFLKSLRPQLQWKPSEEQMEAFKWSLEILNFGTLARRGAMESLYAQLDKLI